MSDNKTIDNNKIKLYEDFKNEIKNCKNVKINVFMKYFSMYALSKLKDEISSVESFNFIYNSPIFEKEKKERKEFYIQSTDREKSISGNQVEIKLKNELSQKYIAKECIEFIKKKVKFKESIKDCSNNSFLELEDENNLVVYTNFQSFTLDGFGYESEDKSTPTIYNKIKNSEGIETYKNNFKDMWNSDKYTKDITNKVLEHIEFSYKENSPQYIYYLTLNNIFNEFLENLDEDTLLNEKTGFKNSRIYETMFDFQKEGVRGIIQKLNKFNVCILADSVGLGKTYSALGVIKYFNLKNLRVLVLCPKRLSENWNVFESSKNYKFNPLDEDKLNYSVLYHTDLLRGKGESNGINLSNFYWENFDLIVIDESHNFRTKKNFNQEKNRHTRYSFLLEEVMKKGVKTKLLLLSATPVNNHFSDLKNQLELAYDGNSKNIDKEIGIKGSIENIFRKVSREFEDWSRKDKNDRKSEDLIANLDLDFFKILDSLTIARSRKHIQNYYNKEEIGDFPEKLKPINIEDVELTNISNVYSFEKINEILNSFSLCIYNPSKYIMESKKQEYEDKYSTKISGEKKLNQETRERGIVKLISILLLKRLESSIESFRKTLLKIEKKYEIELKRIEEFKLKKNYENKDKFIEEDIELEKELEEIGEDLGGELGDKIKIKIGDLDYNTFEKHLKEDYNKIKNLNENIKKISFEDDLKIQRLKNIIIEKVNNPINKNNKKIIIFSAFSDTIKYLESNLSNSLKENYDLNSALITGQQNRSNFFDNKNKNVEMNEILSNFSPKSKKINVEEENQIDILFATDCISEGQNLQDCDYLINYDIHWNPVRIIQRFGRIDRIGSENKVIQLVNFWPPVNLDKYINLIKRVEGRMIAANLAGGGEENLISKKDNVDLEYRKKQMETLKNEVVEIEDFDNSISITDLGLENFKSDLLNYKKNEENLDNVPFGVYGISKKENFEEGVIFVLKNINLKLNIDKTNSLHPFYLIYISLNGDIILDYTKSKNILDIFRKLSKSKSEIDKNLCREFNNETKDGKNMRKYSNLLHKAIESIIEKKNEKDVNSIFKSGGTTFNSKKINGLDDFELITFLILK